MKVNLKKAFFSIVVFCALATLIICAYVFKQNRGQAYVDQDYGFKIDLLEDQFYVHKVTDSGVAEIEFVD